MSPGTEARVGAINRYPVKSMLGEPLDWAVVTTAGIVGDRAYAVIDVADGKVASAKNPAKWRTLLGCRARFTEEPQPDQLVPAVVVTTPDGRQVSSDDPDVDEVLSEVVGRPVRLSSAPAAQPKLDEVWPDIAGLAPEEFVESTRIGANEAGEAISEIPMALFAPNGTYFDVSALHLLTTATLDRLRELEPTADFDPRRYRPNFLVETEATGFVENDWVGQGISLGSEVVASGVLPTMRCVMTTLAHEDLPVDRRTLQTIARHNRIAIPGFGTWACAGIYATVTTPGSVALGDPVTVR